MPTTTTSPLKPPWAMKLAALYPNPNTALANCSGAAKGAGCYAVATPGLLNTDQGDGRVDWHYNDNNSIFGTISWANTSKTSVPPFPGALDGGNFQGSSEQDLGRNAMLSWTHTFSPTMVNEARVGFSRLVTARTQANGTGLGMAIVQRLVGRYRGALRLRNRTPLPGQAFSR